MPSDPSLLHHYRGLSDDITHIAFHPKEIQIAASATDGNILVWSTTDNKAFKFSGHSSPVNCIAFSPTSGRLIASASSDRSVRLWVNSVRGDSDSFRAHNAPVRYVEFNPVDGQHLLTASDDKSVKLWTVDRRKFISSISDHKNWVRCARFSPDGRLIASCSDDSTVRVYDNRTPSSKCLHVFTDQKGSPLHLDFHPGGNCIAVGTSDKKVKVFDVRMRKLQQLYSSHDDAVTQVSFHPSGNFLASSSLDGSMKIFDLLEARPVFDLLGHEKPVTAVVFSPKTGSTIASGGNDSLVFLWQSNLKAKSADDVKRLKDDVEKTKKQITKAKVLSEKFGGKENTKTSEKVASQNSKVVESSIGELMAEKSILAKANEDLTQKVETLTVENLDLTQKVETLTETVILMEKRITLLEDQVRISSSINGLSALNLSKE